jgi:hypothetical protein
MRGLAGISAKFHHCNTPLQLPGFGAQTVPENGPRSKLLAIPFGMAGYSAWPCFCFCLQRKYLTNQA